MIRSNLKSAWRNLLKNKVYSLINISGLSLGLTASILIALWVVDEYSVDAFHDDLDRLYIVTSQEHSGGEITYGGYDTPGLLGEEMPKVLPEVEYSCSYNWAGFRNIAVGPEIVKMQGGFAGKDFFKIFSHPLLIGTRENAIPTKENIAISRRMSVIFFGSPEKAIGQSVKIDNYRDLKVTAVFEDMGSNVSDRLEYVLNWDFFLEREQGWITNWHNSGSTTFLKLREHADREALEKKLHHFIKGYDKEWTDIDYLELGLQPYGEKYLYSNFKNGVVDGGRIEYVRLFEVVAAFILLIACINFMNTSTARSIKRAKEIGVRKAMGALKSVLASQFMLEAFVFTTIAVVLAITLLIILLPAFNLLVSKNIASPVFDIRFWLGIGLLTIITGTIAGSYPALLLSSFKPISALRNNFKVGSSSTSFRKVLVVVQFALSIIFITGTIVVSKQVDFVQNKNLGYQKDNLIYLDLIGNLGRNFDTFKNELMNIPGVTGVTRMSNRPIGYENTTGSVEWEGKQPGTKPNFTPASIGYDFIETMNATLLYGRDFSREFADSSNYIINEAALKIIGYKDPIGMPLTFWGQKGQIVGVVKNFHFNSLHVPIAPLILRLRNDVGYGYAFIRTEPGKTADVVPELEALYKKLNPDFAFAHQFADEEYAAMYESEMIAKKLSQYFAFLSIFISSLGLLGLVIFTAEQRVKEIGIRKVLGASVMQVVTLLSRDFMKLVGIAILFSLPVAYYVSDSWLSGFEYNIGVQWWMFGISASGAIVIALITLSFQAIKAALANPVKSLKVE